MFGLGMQELIIILIVALIVIGPKKLPDLARGLGRALREFRRATDDIKDQIDFDPIITDTREKIRRAHTRTTPQTAPETAAQDTTPPQSTPPDQSRTTTEAAPQRTPPGQAREQQPGDSPSTAPGSGNE